MLFGAVRKFYQKQPHAIVKQICFLNGDVLFLLLFSLPKNWMHNVVWAGRGGSFNQLQGVWISNETHFRMFDIASQKQKFTKFYDN